MLPPTAAACRLFGCGLAICRLRGSFDAASLPIGTDHLHGLGFPTATGAFSWWAVTATSSTLPAVTAVPDSSSAGLLLVRTCVFPSCHPAACADETPCPRHVFAPSLKAA